MSVHTEDTQAVLACAGYDEQDTPQAPQFVELDDRSTHVLPHVVWPDEQALQSPLLQTFPAPQTIPHVPQFFGSELTLTSQPLLEFPSQST